MVDGSYVGRGKYKVFLEIQRALEMAWVVREWGWELDGWG